MDILDYIKPAQLLAIFTFIISVLFLPAKTAKNSVLFLIITVCAFTEILSVFLLYYKKDITLLYSISFIIHHLLWIFLLSKSVFNKNARGVIIGAFLLFGIFNLLFWEGTDELNYFTFIVGALIYISIFTYQSFCQLKYENFDFFFDNRYLMQFSPIVFFFGLSFAFAFRYKPLLSIKLIWNMELYYLIGYFVNIIYYSLINLYIYHENKLNRGD